jgi:hypothetical protein
LDGPEDAGWQQSLAFGPGDTSLYCLAIGSDVKLIKWEAPKPASDGK